MKLILESKIQEDGTIKETAPNGMTVVATPEINEDYWLFRVKLSEEQAIVGFPKFGTVGIGFAKEEDWNTNLPFTVESTEIFNHIKHNKGDDSISDGDCLEAIEMIQTAARNQHISSGRN